MQKTFLLFLFFSVSSFFPVSAQQLKQTIATQEWDYDSLGNHRVIVSVPQAGAIAKSHIEWRRRDQNPAEKGIFVVDAKTNQRIFNTKAENITRESGDVLFEPTSGAGTYYIYYMPYRRGGRSQYYPQSLYYSNHNTATEPWLATIGKSKAIIAQATQLQSVDAFNSFDPMEIIATAKESQALLAKNAAKEYLVFPEDRLHSIRMRHDLPQRWITTGTKKTFSDKADRGENFAFQLGILPVKKDLQNVTVTVSDLKSTTGAVISKKNITCINNVGVNWIGQPETFDVNIPQKEIQPMWTTVQIPENAKPGIYKGIATVRAANAQPTTVAIELTVSNKIAKNNGTDEPWKQTRLPWLNSTIAAKNEVIAPYTPLQLNNDEINLLGRKIKIGKNGFISQIQSFFTPEMTEIGTQAKNILTEPIHFHFTQADGKDLEFKTTPVTYTEKSAGTVSWKTENISDALKLDIAGSVEFDGFVDYEVKVIAQKDVQFNDITLHIPMQPDAATYLMGLGQKGGNRPEKFAWKWDVAHKNQDGAWVGDVNAGLQFSLRDQHYSRPLNTNFYLQKPLILPESWGNGKNGGIDIAQKGKAILVNCFSGARTMKAGDTLYYNFHLLVTPFHALNTDFQWTSRFLHRHLPIDSAKALGASIINIHQGTAINPYINYPFVKTKEMKAYIDSAHALGMKVKIYNTVRELSNRAYELPALFSLNHEIFSPGKGGGYSWLQEHLDTSYIAAWYTPEAHDAAIINSGMSRWHNYYVEGLNWLTQNIGIDGIYLDDVAFDRTIVKRIKRVMTADNHPGLIDLHSANQYNKSDGFNNSANLYMELFPYLNRLWFGEYFDYENTTPDFLLTESSGIPFGVMGEMLQNNGNLWRGMLYGMTNRLLWGGGENMPAADPHPVWKIWDAFGMEGSKMIGYWVKNNPVKTDNPNIPATIYKKEKSTLISIASWDKNPVNVHLKIDWKALGLNPAKATIKAMESKGFQNAAIFKDGDDIPVQPNKGWLLIVSE